jgi:predicted RNA binding protein YcfA (HicA-like mRNA interferase family)
MKSWSRCRHEPFASQLGRRCGQSLPQIGYEVDHQTGSHIILRHPSQRRLTVPNHRELAKGTSRALIREAGLTKEQFADLLG